MADQDPTLRHAITPPAFEKSKLHRARLVDLIHANVQRKLIAIAAPPGYGKTTLLADFSAHTEISLCWMRLTDADQDLMRLMELIRGSLVRRYRRLKKKLDSITFVGSTPDAIAIQLVEVIDKGVDEPLVLIIDDVQIINRSRLVVSFLDALLDMLPEQVTILASGREVLEVSLAQLMAQGELFGIGPHDLALTREELSSLAEVSFGTQLNEDELIRLFDESRGWITGVLLSGRLAMDGMSTTLTRSRPMVYEYLASVVLNRLQDQLRRFMIDSSVLPLLSSAICDELLDRDDSQLRLARLSREGIFLTATSDSPRTYEFHPQFRQFLIESLQASDPKRLSRLRKKAAVILEANAAPDQAISLYFDSGDIKRASRLADANAKVFFKAGRTRTLEDWATKVVESRGSAPILFKSLATALVDKGDLERAKWAIDNALSMFGSTISPTDKASLLNLSGSVSLQMGENAKALEVANEVEALLLDRYPTHPELAASFRLKAQVCMREANAPDVATQYAQAAVEILAQYPEDYNLAVALIDLASVQASAGKRLEGQAGLSKAHEILVRIGAPLPLAVSLNNLAIEAHFDGRYEEALDLFSQSLKYARRAASPVREANAIYGQADLFNDLGLVLPAAELYGDGLTISTKIDNPWLIKYGCIRTSVLHRRWGRGNLAHEWLRRAIGQGSLGSLVIAERVQLAALQLLASPSNARAALQPLVESNLDAADRTLIGYFVARTHLTDMDEVAEDKWRETLDWAGISATEQVLASELLADDKFRDLLTASTDSGPVMDVVLGRIETMRAISRRYQAPQTRSHDKTVLSIAALGNVAIEWRGERIQDLKPQEREVLHYLVDKGKAERDDLVELFWPEHPPGRQTANLHMVVYGLRRILGKGLISLQGSIYSLSEAGKLEYDVARFERAASIGEGMPNGDPKRYFALTEAINAYGGPFLPEFSSDWVIERRRRLELRFLDLLAGHAEEALVRDQPLQAIRTLRRALDIDPYRDDINSRYLESLGRLERRSEIVAHYQRYVNLLSQELGLDPPESVRRLYSTLIG